MTWAPVTLRNPILLGAGILSLAYWVLDAFLDTLAFGNRLFIDNLIDPDGDSLWMRIATAVTLIIFGYVTQKYADREKRAAVELIRTRSTLDQRNEEFRRAFDRTGIPTIMTRKGVIVKVNEAFCTLLGYTSAEFLKLTPAEITHPDDRGAVGQMAKKIAVTLNKSFSCEKTYLHKNGSEVPALVSLTAIGGGDDTPVLTLIQAIDISRQKEVEETLRSAKTMSDQSSEAKSRFLTNMSHDFRTPLNSIIGFSEAIKMELMGPVGVEKYREYAQDIYDSGKHLLGLINDILNISRLESGVLELEEELIDIEHMTQTCLRMLSSKIDEAGVGIEVQIEDEGYYLYADALRTRQVFVNVLENSLKFTPPGGAIRWQTRVDDTARLEFVISDTGCGIEPDFIDRIWEPFCRSGVASNHNKEGLGLGLPLCKSIMQLHGGEIFVESRVGAGTKVIIRFPPDRARQPVASRMRV